MKYFLCSDEDAIYLNSDRVQLINKKKPYLLQENSVNILFSTTQSKQPAKFICNPDNFLQNECVKRVEFNDFTLIQPIFEPQEKISKIKSKTYQNITAIFLSFPPKFIIEMNDMFFVHACTKLKEFICFRETRETIILQGESMEEDYVAIFHKTSQKFYEFKGEFNLGREEITLIENSRTLAGHGKLKIFEITKEDIEKRKEQTIYIKGAPKNVPPFLNHIAFFEAVREQDYRLAETYLTGDLKSVLQPPHYKQFFGTFEGIAPIKHNNETKIALIVPISPYYSQASLYTLTYCGEHIQDIAQD